MKRKMLKTVNFVISLVLMMNIFTIIPVEAEESSPTIDYSKLELPMTGKKYWLYAIIAGAVVCIAGCGTYALKDKNRDDK